VISLFFLGMLLALLFEFKIRFSGDEEEECWKAFKSNNCNLNNPTSLTCKKLYECVSGESWEVKIVYIVVFVALSLLGVRFRTQIVEGVTIFAYIVQNVIDNHP